METTTTTDLYSTAPSATDSANAAAAQSLFSAFGFIYLIILVVTIVALWKIFTKAGKPGWASLVPFYNIYLMLKIIGRPGWWLLLFFIPVVNIIISIIIALDLGKSFGKDAVWSIVLLFLLAPLGHAVLGFSSAQYTGAAAASDGTTPMPPTIPPTQPPSAPTPPTPPVPPATPPAGPTSGL